jgi:hypothetical protein
MNDMTIFQPGAHVTTLTAEGVKAQVQLIQKVMKAVMKEGTHYGQIPGTDKPTLYKAGSEVLLTTFRIAAEPEVTDLSTEDEIRYRVRVTGRHQTTGIVIGAGIGECSSNEEKYRWRNAVCDEEFNETPEDRRRLKWQRGKEKPYQRKQIRTVPADVANTVLKMSKKRAQIDMTLTSLAASDCFTQDLEDMPEELRETVAGQQAAEPTQSKKPSTAAPQAKTNGGHCTERQAKLISVKLDQAGIPEIELFEHFSVQAVADIPFGKVNDALAWIAKAHEEQ